MYSHAQPPEITHGEGRCRLMNDLIEDAKEGHTKGREGRVAGIRVTAAQAQQLWDLALGGFSDNAQTVATFKVGGERIWAETLDRLWEKVGDRDILDNLHLEALQKTPYREVSIRLGPGKWTTYTVNAEDPTWALGRYEELTERLTAHRSFLVAVATKRPEIALPGADDEDPGKQSGKTRWVPRDVWTHNQLRKWEMPTSLTLALVRALALTSFIYWILTTIGKITGRDILEGDPITPAELSYRGLYFWAAVTLGFIWIAAKRATYLQMQCGVRLKPHKAYDTGTLVMIAAAVASAVGTVIQAVK